MKKIVCPNCGVQPNYELIRHYNKYAFFDGEGNLIKEEEGEKTYEGREPRCPICGHKVKIGDPLVDEILELETVSLEDGSDGYDDYVKVSDVLRLLDERNK